MHHARRQHGELAAAAAGNQVVGFRVIGTGTFQLLPDRLQQLISPLPTQTLVEPRQILDPQQQQVARSRLFQVTDLGVELHLEIAAVGQPGETVLV